MSYQLTDVQVAQVWDLYSQGKSARAIARHFYRSTAAMSERIVRAGGIRPTIPHRAERHLTLEEREEISRGLAAECSFREIARRLGRAPSTVSREVNNNGGRNRYRAAKADKAAVVRRRRPRVCKLAGSPRLRREVVAGLQHKWAPEQIAGSLRRRWPNEPEMWVSHPRRDQSRCRTKATLEAPGGHP